MLEFLPALGAMMGIGSSNPIAKKAIEEAGRERAIVYTYLSMAALLLLGAIIFDVRLELPSRLWIPYIAQVGIGTAAIMLFFKALEQGRASIMDPLSKLHVLVVIAVGILVFGEYLSTVQLAGAALTVVAALVIARDRMQKDGWEAGWQYLALTIFGWGYYFSFVKLFINEIGFYSATVFLEVGIAVCVTAYYVFRKKSAEVLRIQNTAYAIGRGVLTFGGVLLYYYSVAEVGIALTAAVVAGTPIVNAVVSRALLGERLDTYKYLAILLLVAGLIAIFIF